MMQRRRQVVCLSLVSATCMGVVAPYQIGLLEHVPEPATSTRIRLYVTIMSVFATRCEIAAAWVLRTFSSGITSEEAASEPGSACNGCPAAVAIRGAT